MDDKIKQYVALIGGFLGALLLFLGNIGASFDWFTLESIDSFVVTLGAFIALVFATYGIYKNSYRLSEKAKRQEDLLKKRGLK